MAFRPQPLPPLVSLSTAPSLLRLSTLFRLAQSAGADGIDLDLSGPPLPEPSRVAQAAERHGVPVRSVWMPRASVWSGWNADRARTAAAAVARATDAGIFIIEGPITSDGGVPRSAVTALTETARPLLSPGTRIVVVLRPRHLEGGRRHLVQLTAWRRLAEEWEFGIGLDLSGPVDGRWEAEAAVSRLGSRLTLMRLPSDVVAAPATGARRAAVRAFAAAIDGGHPAQFAVVPGAPLWQSGHVAGQARRFAETRRRITERYTLIEEQRALDVFPHPWPGQRG